MQKYAPRAVFIILCAVLGLTISGAAQTARPNFNRPQKFDVQHYLMRISFDRTAKRVLGDTTVSLSPSNSALSQITLDSVGISYDSVTLEGDAKKLKQTTAGGSITIDLPRTYLPGETISLRFTYKATPKKGIYFVDPLIENGRVTRSAQIWTQGEAEETRHWLPSFDHPGDKATSEQYITANAGETVIGNGTPLEKKTNGDGTVTHHFKMEVPHSTYLISFVIGKYTEVKDKFGDVPLGYYVYPGREQIIPAAFGKTKQMLNVFEELTGVKFPFNKYDQTVVASFTFGGMENITATTLSDTDVLLAHSDLFKSGVEDLVSHELAHSWFGNLVTCRNWAELWLNEGLATFMEAAFREKAYGRPNYLLKIQNDAAIFMADDAINQKRNGLYNENAGNADRLFDRPATTYNKGGVVVHMLREEIGETAFWKGVNTYLTTNKFGSVETAELKDAMETAAGRDLEWFFDQWVYGTSYPKLNVHQVFDPQSKTLRLNFSQTQKPDRLIPSAFRIPLEIELKIGDNLRTEKIEITKRSESFTFAAEVEPKVRLDPNQKIPLKSVKFVAAARSASR